MKKVALITALTLGFSALPASAVVSDVVLEKGTLDRAFDASRTLYYVTVDEELSVAPSITATGATPIKEAEDITSPIASKRVTILADDETGKEYRFVINGNRKYVSLEEMSISQSGLLTLKYSASDSAYANLIVFKPKADDTATTDKDEAEESFGFADVDGTDDQEQILLIKELESGEEKTFTYQLPAAAPAGMYTAVLGGEGVAKANKDDMSSYYMTKTAWETVLPELSLVTDEAGLTVFMTKYAVKLGLDLAEYNGFTDKSVYVSHLVKKNFTDGDSFMTELNVATALSKVNTADEDKILLVLNENAGVLGIDIKGIYSELDKKSSVGDAIAASEKFSTAAELQTAFNEKTAVTYINEAEPSEISTRYDNVKDTLFTKEAQEKLSKLDDEDRSAVLRKLVNKNFTDKKDVADTLDEQLKPTGGSGSGGGGSYVSPSKPSGPASVPGNFDSEKKEDGTPEVYEPIEEKPPVVNTSKFTDLEKYGWAREAILLLADRKVLNGKADRLFAPGDKVKREEFAKMVVLAFELDGKTDKMEFEDVKDTDWYAEYINTAVKEGVTKGKTQTRFGVGEFITRQEMAVMIHRAAKAAGVEIPDKINSIFKQEVFTDSNLIADYAKTIVDALYRAGMINGVGEGRFSPNATATRAQAAQMIYNVIKGH